MKQQIQLRRREVDETADLPAELPPLLRRLYASRGVRSAQELERSVKGMLPWQQLSGVEKAVEILYNAFREGTRIIVVGDFDADGATSTALSVLAMRSLGCSNIDYLVPNRFEDGYGLSPEVVDQAHARGAQLIVTVDNGISSHAGVVHARSLGIPVIVTDHHLPGETLPAAEAIINPNLRDCNFPSKSLAGVGAQYDSELVYHNVRAEVAAQGVVYTDLESAMHGEYAEMIRTHFMHLVKPQEHKFAALHGAVWSGGSFVYVPKGVSVTIPLQSYFRLNAPGAGQFEHTLIIVDEGAYLHFIEGCSAPKYNVANLHAGCVELYVGKNAKLRYSTIENWSKNMYNLNTKRAIVEEGGTIEWVSGSFGSHVSYLYPMSILKGDDSRMEFTGITFAGEGQNLDTGAKVVHTGKRTSSYINTKSISKDGGISTFRSSVQIGKQASGSKASVSCQSLMLDDISRSDTVPAMDIRTRDANVGHEAKIGRISDEAVFYLMSRGISEEDARAMIVSGFADDVSKELPLEYAVEMNNLIQLEMKGSIG